MDFDINNFSSFQVVYNFNGIDSFGEYVHFKGIMAQSDNILYAIGTKSG